MCSLNLKATNLKCFANTFRLLFFQSRPDIELNICKKNVQQILLRKH